MTAQLSKPPPLRITAIELPARFAQVDRQLLDAERILADSATDLAVLPEASLTGYVSEDHNFDLSSFSEDLHGETLRTICNLARRTQTALAFPLIEKARGAHFNSLCGVSPDGTVLFCYRKRHPWYPERWATPGDDPYPRFTIRGLRFTAAICFDIHFMEAEAEETLAWADVLLFPSAWVDDDGDSRSPLLQDIADRFDLTVVNANWGVGTPAIRGQGGTRIVMPRTAAKVVSAEGRPAQRVDALVTSKR